MSDQNHDLEEPLKLSPEQHAMVLVALAAKERGEPSYTLEEARDFARKRTKVWMKDSPSQTA